MTTPYQIQLEALRNEIVNGSARPAVIDQCIASLLQLNDKMIPSDFLGLLSDHSEYDEGMFSLIHAAETADNKTYVSVLIYNFPLLATSSPRWASIVLMRVLNSNETRSELVKQLLTAFDYEKQSFRIMCERINSVSPEFLSKTVPIFVAASSTTPHLVG